MSKPAHDHTKCRELFEKLSEYIDQELELSTCQEIEKHLKQCAPCNVCLETLKSTIRICKRVEDQPVPTAFSRQLKEMIQSLTQ